MPTANTKKPSITASLDKRINVTAPVNHKDLLGLDYEHSGHIGFASEQRVSILEKNKLSKRLSVLSELPSTAENKDVYLYADYKDESYRISLNNISGGANVRTVTEVPDDIRVNDYIFIEKEN